jgi:competence protein ComEA
MKRFFESYGHFTRTERNGLFALLSLICLLLLIRVLLPVWVKPGTDPEEQNRLNLAWNEYKSRNTHVASAEVRPATAELFPFDPNSLDSPGFIRLGLRPKTAHLLLNWRRKGKVFYRPSDLKPLYTLREDEYARLEPYILIPAQNRSPNERHYDRWKADPLPAFIDLNATDSQTLVRLNGIGPVLAHRIIERRNALGGFLKIDQLAEIYRFPDTTFRMLREKLRIDPVRVRKLDINQASLGDLSAHPYIGEKMARNILLLRQGLHRFENLEQLKQVPLMNEENYRKIAPYFSIAN